MKEIKTSSDFCGSRVALLKWKFSGGFHYENLVSNFYKVSEALRIDQVEKSAKENKVVKQ